jgi:hypothetical protein
MRTHHVAKIIFVPLSAFAPFMLWNAAPAVE